MRDDVRGRQRLLDVLRLVFSALAIGLVVLGLFALRERSRSRGWATTAGTIASSSVSHFTDRNGTTYRPLVMYGYSVGAVRFMSSRLAFRSAGTSDREAAMKAAGRYKPGSRVQVFYDPLEPEQAVLDRGVDPWGPIVAGGVFAMLTVWTRILRGRPEKRGG